MLLCPKCSSKELRRSHTRNGWERLRKDITGKRPYRCRECNWRGWKRIDGEEPSPAMRAAAPEPPNLRRASLARQDPREDIDLKELDQFQIRHDKDQG